MGLFASPMAIVLAIVSLGVLIIVHEGGHYLVARLSGMRVDRFSIGFGPTLWSFQRGETIYQIAAIPFGGFVQIAGMTPGEEGMTEDDPRAYPNRPAWQRLLTIFAGPGTNYLFAALVMILVYAIYGVPVPGQKPMVTTVVEGKPAATAGIKPGDEIVSIDGQKVEQVSQVKPLISASKGRQIDIALVRDGKPQSVKLKAEPDKDDWLVGIGIGEKPEFKPAPFGTVLTEALLFPYEYSRDTLHAIGQMIAGRLKPSFTGPVGIVRVIKEQIQGGFKNGLSIIAIISVCLGLYNLLPLPALDGGRIVFLAFELISRRKVNQRFEQTVHMVGMVALLCFLVYVTFGHDLPLGRLFKH